jgi:hypothetical protein
MSEKELGVYNVINLNLDRVFGSEQPVTKAAE